MRSSPGSVEPPHAILRNVVQLLLKSNLLMISHTVHSHIFVLTAMITLGIVRGVHVSVWKVGLDWSNVLLFSADPLRTLTTVRSARRIAAPVAFGCLLASVKTLFPTVETWKSLGCSSSSKCREQICDTNLSAI